MQPLPRPRRLTCDDQEPSYSFHPTRLTTLRMATGLPLAVRDLVYKYGSRSTPTTVVDDEVIVGFDPERLDQLLVD